MKLKKSILILANLYLILGATSIFSSNMMMILYPTNAYLIPFFILLLLSFTLFFIPKKHYLKSILNSKILKILLLTYTIISTYLFMISYLKITYDYFYNLTSPMVILSIILLISLLISLYSAIDIINFSVIITSLILSMFTLILFNTIKYDFSLIIKNFNPNINLFYLPSFIFIYLDVFIFNIFTDEVKLNKKDYFFIFLISSLINSFLIVKNYLFFHPDFFINAKFPYLFKYLVYSNKNIYEHLEILYLAVITVFFIFKLATTLRNIRITLKFKKSNPILFFILLFFILILYLSNYLDINFMIINYLMLASTIFLILFLIILKIKHKGETNEKRNI